MAAEVEGKKSCSTPILAILNSSAQVSAISAPLTPSRTGERAASDTSGAAGSGQVLAIHLAAGEHRRGLEHVEKRRHHVGRQPGPQHVEHLAAIELSRRLAQHHVGRKRGHAVALEQSHGGAGDLRLLQQYRLDLGQLHAEAADFHLTVDAAEELELALVVEAHEVAGAIEAAPGVLNERLGRQLRLVEVAARHPGPADIKLAFLAARDRAHVGVENESVVTFDAMADGYRTAGLQHGQRRVDGGFRGAIDVEHLAAGPGPPRNQLLGRPRR
jgi:hypothetical protein